MTTSVKNGEQKYTTQTATTGPPIITLSKPQKKSIPGEI
jgi:hypothetical protein